MLGGAMLNGQKIKSPLISIKFGDILESAFDKTYKTFRRKNFTGKVLFCKKTLKIRLFRHFFTYKTTLRGVFRQLSSINLALNIFYALIIHMKILEHIWGNILNLKGTFVWKMTII